MNLNAISRTISRGVLHLRNASPELLTGLGVAGVVATAVLASLATLKVEEVVEEHTQALENVERSSGDMDDATYAGRKTRVFLDTTVNLAKLYGPTILVGVASIASLIGSNRILRGRNVALAAAYQAVATAYDQYRSRVRAEYGEDVDNDFHRGIKPDEKGLRLYNYETGEVTTNEDIGYSPYARIFDASSRLWEKSPETNMFVLTKIQKIFNDKLEAEGHVFLNDVYTALGFPKTPAGQIVGWLWNGDGDNFIDFGIYTPRSSEFVNGYEPVIMLDFNVDGPIYEAL